MTAPKSSSGIFSSCNQSFFAPTQFPVLAFGHFARLHLIDFHSKYSFHISSPLKKSSHFPYCSYWLKKIFIHTSDLLVHKSLSNWFASKYLEKNGWRFVCEGLWKIFGIKKNEDEEIWKKIWVDECLQCKKMHMHCWTNIFVDDICRWRNVKSILIMELVNVLKWPWIKMSCDQSLVSYC